MKKIVAIFYENSNGMKPVRDWLLSLDKEDRKSIGVDIKTIEYGFPIGMPVCKKLASKLYEVRSNISSKRIARVIFTIESKYMILLNGFIKKDQKTPKSEIDISIKRKKEIQ
ncbi:MAG: type II toxin-antitoxin system RelE/ParE family toxin [Campylobacteraceae bacterium]|jgi:phage-related protein|nr:type II toxin-antitoxin system RelE/ParE family toxin [Campylobacteraceae bacterium]